MDWLVGAITILTVELIARRSWVGWLVGLMNQALWAVIIVERQLWGLLPLCLVLTWRYSMALVRWRAFDRHQGQLVAAMETHDHYCPSGDHVWSHASHPICGAGYIYHCERHGGLGMRPKGAVGVLR